MLFNFSWAFTAEQISEWVHARTGVQVSSYPIYIYICVCVSMKKKLAELSTEESILSRLCQVKLKVCYNKKSDFLKATLATRVFAKRICSGKRNTTSRLVCRRTETTP